MHRRATFGPLFFRSLRVFGCRWPASGLSHTSGLRPNTAKGGSHANSHMRPPGHGRCPDSDVTLRLLLGPGGCGQAAPECDFVSPVPARRRGFDREGMERPWCKRLWRGLAGLKAEGQSSFCRRVGQKSILLHRPAAYCRPLLLECGKISPLADRYRFWR